MATWCLAATAAAAAAGFIPGRSENRSTVTLWPSAPGGGEEEAGRSSLLRGVGAPRTRAALQYALVAACECAGQ